MCDVTVRMKVVVCTELINRPLATCDCHKGIYLAMRLVANSSNSTARKCFVTCSAPNESNRSNIPWKVSDLLERARQTCRSNSHRKITVRRPNKLYCHQNYIEFRIITLLKIDINLNSTKIFQTFCRAFVFYCLINI